MKRLLTSIAALSLTAGTSLAATVDFDGQSNGFIATGTSFDGLIFTTDVLIRDAGAGTGPGQTGKVAQQATPPFGGDPKGGSVTGMFDGFSVSSLSFVVGDSGGDLDIFRLIGYNASGTAVANSGTTSSRSAITVAIAGTGITSFLLEIADQPDNNGSSFFDNVNFQSEVAAVPLPASLPLIGFGLLALGATARRRAG
jgi:hypothetical protein